LIKSRLAIAGADPRESELTRAMMALAFANNFASEALKQQLIIAELKTAENLKSSGTTAKKSDTAENAGKLSRELLV